MRLRYGPHRGRLAQQVVLREPDYVVQCLVERPDGVLAAVFAELIGAFDAKPMPARCNQCGGRANGACAYAAQADLLAFCASCLERAPWSGRIPANWIVTYEDALRHVAETFPRGRRVGMSRIIGRLTLLKGGPQRATERAAVTFFQGGDRRPAPGLEPPCWAHVADARCEPTVPRPPPAFPAARAHAS